MRNKKICVVGAGMWGYNHVKTLDTLDCLGGVVDPNRNRIRKIKKNFSRLRYFFKS